MSPEVNIILGPPGTGKTENLLRIVDEELKNNTGPDKLAFVSFTTKATDEARDRAKSKFNYTDDDLPYFRTLHSFGKRQLHMANSEVMRSEDYRKFSDDYGIDMNFVSADWNDNGIVTTDNIFLRDYNKSRMKMEELDEYHNKLNPGYDFKEFLKARNSLEEFKHDNSKSDFTDMLSLFVETGNVPDLDVVIVDEAQDLSLLQWKVCEKIFKNAKRVYISGDDDQAIFRWAGADVEYLINMKGNKRVLDQSYRCPRLVHNVADEIVQRIVNRLPKVWKPRDVNGEARFHAYTEGVDVREGNWLVLATCKYMYAEMEDDLRIQGLPYKKNGKLPIDKELLNAVDTWDRLHCGEHVSYKNVEDMYSYLPSKKALKHGHKNMKSFIDEDKSYDILDLKENHGLKLSNVPWDVAFNSVGKKDAEYIRNLQRFDNIRQDPKINMSTIHVAKGGECDNVMLMTDLSRANQIEMEQDSDDTNRVMYVGATRAKKSLHVISNQNYGGFKI